MNKDNILEWNICEHLCPNRHLLDMYIQSVFNQRCFKLKCVLVLKHGLCTGMTLVLAAITLDNYCIPNRRVLTWWRQTSEIWHIVIANVSFIQCRKKSRFLFEGQVCKLECSPIYIGILRKLTLSCFSWKSKKQQLYYHFYYIHIIRVYLWFWQFPGYIILGLSHSSDDHMWYKHHHY